MPKGVYIHKKGCKRQPFSEEWKRNISLGSAGKKLTSEHRAKISRGVLVAFRNPIILEKLRVANKLNNNQPPHGRGFENSNWKGGRPKCLDCDKIVCRRGCIRCRKCLDKYLVGEKSPSWQGGKTITQLLIRSSAKYKEWRESIFVRDNYVCQLCGQRGGKLNADHIKPFALYPELRLEESNGRTLCVPCHRKTNTWGGVRIRKIVRVA